MQLKAKEHSSSLTRGILDQLSDLLLEVEVPEGASPQE